MPQGIFFCLVFSWTLVTVYSLLSPSNALYDTKIPFVSQIHTDKGDTLLRAQGKEVTLKLLRYLDHIYTKSQGIPRDSLQ